MDENTSIGATQPCNAPIYNKEAFLKIFTLISTCILAVMAWVCFRFYFDAGSMYLAPHPVVYIFYGLIALTVITSLILCIISRDSAIPQKNKIIGYPACGCMLAIAISAMLDGKLLIFILALSTAAFFADVFKKSIIGHTLLGFVGVAWCITTIAQTYFSNDIPINSPIKLICQIGIALGMLTITSDIRIFLGAGRLKIHKFLSCLTCYINFSAVCAMLAIGSSKIPDAFGNYFLPALALALYSVWIFSASSTTIKDTADSPVDEQTAPIQDLTDEKGQAQYENND